MINNIVVWLFFFNSKVSLAYISGQLDRKLSAKTDMLLYCHFVLPLLFSCLPGFTLVLSGCSSFLPQSCMSAEPEALTPSQLLIMSMVFHCLQSSLAIFPFLVVYHTVSCKYLASMAEMKIFNKNIKAYSIFDQKTIRRAYVYCSFMQISWEEICQFACMDGKHPVLVLYANAHAKPALRCMKHIITRKWQHAIKRFLNICSIVSIGSI